MTAPQHDLQDRLIGFGVPVCLLADRFPSTPLGKHVALQLVRCGTSPFANHAEAQSAESQRDFVHKLRICLKEMREAKAWLRSAGRMQMCNVESAIRESDELIAILVVSVRTAARSKPVP